MSENLKRALRQLIRTDGCSNSWDIQYTIDDMVSAIDDHIKAEFDRMLQEKFGAARKE
jgi:hypothetical protein